VDRTEKDSERNVRDIRDYQNSSFFRIKTGNTRKSTSVWIRRRCRQEAGFGILSGPANRFLDETKISASRFFCDWRMARGRQIARIRIASNRKILRQEITLYRTREHRL